MSRQKRQGRSSLIVGLMSGTSVDGVEAVLARVSGSGSGLKARLLAHVHRRFSDALRRRILEACLRGTVSEICELNFVLGEQFARAAGSVIRKAGADSKRVTAIASHGQTVHHLPIAKFPSTLQIGEPAVIAERTGILTVSNFRVRDMAAGGQGAPLVPYADWALFTSASRPRLLLNIGGIANVTFLPARASLKEVRAFDTGPGNMVIDAVTARFSGGRKAFDRGGGWAARGKVSAGLLAELMRHPFLERKPPKTTGREEFGEAFVENLLQSARRRRLKPEDIVATVTAFTTESIVAALGRFILPQLGASAHARLEILVGGGGVRNLTLMNRLAQSVVPAAVKTLDEIGFSSAAREALAFAILGHETLRGVPSNVPFATGARHSVVLGTITPARPGAVRNRLRAARRERE